jgi:transposase InsO family protein
MVTMPIATKPWEKIIFDIVGPLERSKKGNLYMLVVIDVHTHFPEAFPLKSIDSKSIATALVRLFTRVGIPAQIQHDQASNFMSKMMSQLYSMLGIRNITSSCYHAATNGLVERLNGTIKRLLKTCLIERDPRDWDQILDLVLFSLRSSKHETTGLSPFELMFGYPIRGPLDIVKELWVEEPKEGEPIEMHQYVLDLRTTMRELSKQAVERETAVKAEVKDRYDLKAELVEFKEGEKVFLLIPQMVSSLSPSWSGPYLVEKKTGPVTYQILTHDKKKRRRIVHANMLRPYIPRISCFITNESEEIQNKIPASFPESITRTLTSKDIFINPKLSQIQNNSIKNLLLKFDAIFSDLPGCTDIIEHEIRTIDNDPIHCVPYTIPYALIPEVEKEISIALKLGLIEPVINGKNPTAYAAPIILVKKKEKGLYRVCVDHRKLNLETIMPRYCLPNASHLVDKVSSAKYLSIIDMTRAYNQVRICESDIPKTGFLALGKHYVSKFMSFGLCGAPATFQLLIDTVLAGMETFAVAFLDDLCVFSNTFEEHLNHLTSVFGALKSAKLTAHPTKVKLAMFELLYLGHLVGGGKRAVDTEKINVLEKIKVPRSKRDVRSFLGFVGFYKSFIKDYSEIASPLTDLLKKDSPDLIPWSSETQRAFETLKRSLQEAPVLISPDFSKEMYVLCDSSQVACGAALCHMEHGQLRPILFLGKKFSPAETRLSALERELLGILTVLNKLRFYLMGHPFYLLTDAKGLIFLKNKASINNKLTRWLLLLSEFDFKIGHVKGSQFQIPDYLSRFVEYTEIGTLEKLVDKL